MAPLLILTNKNHDIFFFLRLNDLFLKRSRSINNKFNIFTCINEKTLINKEINNVSRLNNECYFNLLLRLIKLS